MVMSRNWVYYAFNSSAVKSCFRLKCNVQEPECIRDILINTAKHLGSLKFEIWKKMVNLVRYGGSSDDQSSSVETVNVDRPAVTPL